MGQKLRLANERIRPTRLHAIACVAVVLAVAMGMSGSALAEETKGVGVSATVPQSLTFTVAPILVPPGVTVSSTAVDFGNITPGTAKTAGHRLTAACNGQSGYSVTAAENRPLTFGTNVIPDFTGDTPGDASESIEGTWNSPGTAGFGYTLANANGSSAAAFTGGYRRFANSANSELAQGIMHSDGPTNADSVDVTYKLNASGSQVAGTYSNTLTYIATGGF